MRLRGSSRQKRLGRGKRMFIDHLNVLKHTRNQREHLIARVVADDFVESAKGKRPVIPLAELLEIVPRIKVVNEARPEFA